MIFFYNYASNVNIKLNTDFLAGAKKAHENYHSKPCKEEAKIMNDSKLHQIFMKLKHYL